jgi:hypothetical protein
VTGSAPARSRSGRGTGRLALGIAVLLLALVGLGVSRARAASGHHAYDPGSAPRSNYRVTVGGTYQLSTAGGVRDLTRRGVIGDGSDLRCTADAANGSSTPLSVDQTGSDARDLHIVGSFVAPASGSFTVQCAGAGAVYVDDADNASTDRSAVLVVVASVLGLVGVIATLSGAYRALEVRARDTGDCDQSTAGGGERDTP